MSTSSVTSEALQLKLRQLLPSQQGFGTDLSASDTIIPIVDLTAAAEGSDVPQNLQTAVNFGGTSSFNINGATRTTIVNQPGFFLINYAHGWIPTTTSGTFNLELYDGASYKVLFDFKILVTASAVGYQPVSSQQSFVVFLGAGESLLGTMSATGYVVNGNTRQIATSNGTLIQPVGFNPQ